MRRLSAVTLAVSVSTCLTITEPVLAGDAGNVQPTPPPPTARPFALGQTIGSLIIGPGGQVGGAGARDGCTWERVNPSAIDDGDFENEDSAVRRVKDGREQVLVHKYCDGVVVASGWAWATPTPAELTVGLLSAVERQLPGLTPDLNPPGPGYVNLGMWLAVSPAGPIVVPNDVAGWSVVVTATHTDTTFEIGGLATISCSGFGTPIVDTDTVAEGPCGYTFRSVPQPSTVPITISANWFVTFTTPLGDGDLGTISSTVQIPYAVREIQTVGTGG